MLMSEVWANISNVFEHMQNSHVEAAEAMKSMKKLVTTIPVGAFRLLLQACVQPHIMMQCCHLWQVKHDEPKEQHHEVSLLDMIPDGKEAQNLPRPVKTLVAIIHYEVKTETGIRISIAAMSQLFGTQEKSLWQALKGVKYESGTQKCRWESATHNDKESSSSEEDDDDGDEPEGVLAKIKPLKHKKKKSKQDHWKVKQWHTEVASSLQSPPGPLHPPVPHQSHCIPNFTSWLTF